MGIQADGGFGQWIEIFEIVIVRLGIFDIAFRGSNVAVADKTLH